MKITFDNQKELDIYVTNKILDAHKEWCTNFDLIIKACIKDKDFLILAQYYTQNPDILSKITEE